MKKVFAIFMIAMLMLVAMPFSFADTAVIRVSLSDEEILVNDTEISNEENGFIYLSNGMNNGASSEVAMSANIAVQNVINIESAGVYEFSGTLSDGQIAVNANNINGEVRIILNNVNITCEEAPAVFVYSKDTESENCKVIISTASGSENTVTSNGKVKVSVEGWEDQSSVLYSIEKDYDDSGEYFERYKYDAAISSDISLIFDGEGILNVNSNEKEGIESKMHLTFNEGTYIINSYDDALNASADGKSIITINDGFIVANVLLEAEEGDGIDSNGYLYINGGTVYAFANPGSDSGIDSDLGTYINGGTVIAIGDMFERVNSENDNTIIQMQLLNKVSDGDTILIVDENNDTVFAFKSDRDFSVLTFSSANLKGENYGVYSGTSVDGILDEYNVYTEVTSFDLNEMTKQENSISGGMNNRFDRDFQNVQNTSNSTVYIICIVAAVVLLIGIVVVNICFKQMNAFTIISLMIGIIIGILATLGIVMIARNNTVSNFENFRDIPNNDMMEMPGGNIPDGRGNDRFQQGESMNNII